MSTSPVRLACVLWVLPFSGIACKGNINRDTFTLAVTLRASVDTAGHEANTASSQPALSGDGRYVAFFSTATDLVSGNTNLTGDVYRHDLQTGLTELVSVSMTGGSANGQSQKPSLSHDGQFVAFQSSATNLASNVTGMVNIYVRDMVAGTTVLASVSADPLNPTPNGGSSNASLSADGRYVAFDSIASNLVAGAATGFSDIYRRDLMLNATVRVGLTSLGAQSTLAGPPAFGDPHSGSLRPSISADGSIVAFHSSCTDLVPNDINGFPDVFVRDLNGTTTRVSVGLANGGNASGTSINASISGDGRFVAFQSNARDIISPDLNAGVNNIIIYDRVAATSELVSVNSSGLEGQGDSTVPSTSGDGRYVAFKSAAPNLVDGDTNNTPDDFLRDRINQTTIRVSVATGGTQTPFAQPSGEPSLSTDGRFVAFSSIANNLVAGITNGVTNIFVRGPLY